MRSAVKPCRAFTGFAWVSFCLLFNGAQAQSIADETTAIPLPDGIASASLSDLIFDAGFEGQRNGGTSCATANVLEGETTYSGDTTATSNWMTTFGPLLSSSNDVVYVFVAGPDVGGSITPTASNYSFAMYLIPSCTDSGTEPQPIAATATLGRGIDLVAAGVISGNTYYLAITGVASGGAGANGTLNFTTPPSLGNFPRR